MSDEEKTERDAYAAGEYERELEQIKFLRHSAYISADGSDAVFMKWQRGEATKEEWLKAKEAIDIQYPYPKK
jgi:hypothetical protein